MFDLHSTKITWNFLLVAVAVCALVSAQLYPIDKVGTVKIKIVSV